MPGGVGGVASRGVPLSRSWAHLRHSPADRQWPAWAECGRAALEDRSREAPIRSRIATRLSSAVHTLTPLKPRFKAGEWFNACRLAIETAFSHMDDGCVVYCVGVRSLGDAITKDQVGRVYALWLKAKPFSKYAMARRNRASDLDHQRGVP
jgi:hypothetical protein